MKEVLLVGPIGSSEAAPETDADIEQGAKSAICHEDDPQDWVGDALRFCVWGLAVGVGYAPVEDWAENQSSDYSGGVAAGHKNIINVWSFIYQENAIEDEEMEGNCYGGGMALYYCIDNNWNQDKNRWPYLHSWAYTSQAHLKSSSS